MAEFTVEDRLERYPLYVNRPLRENPLSKGIRLFFPALAQGFVQHHPGSDGDVQTFDTPQHGQSYQVITVLAGILP